MLDRIKKIFFETCQQMEVELIEFSGKDDPVHLMVCCPPKLAIANLVGKLKGKSSYFIRKEFWEELKDKLWADHFWSPSYCVLSCGGAPLEIIKQYIQNQRQPLESKQLQLSQNYIGRKRDSMKKWLA